MTDRSAARFNYDDPVKIVDFTPLGKLAGRYPFDRLKIGSAGVVEQVLHGGTVAVKFAEIPGFLEIPAACLELDAAALRWL